MRDPLAAVKFLALGLLKVPVAGEGEFVADAAFESGAYARSFDCSEPLVEFEFNQLPTATLASTTHVRPT